MANENGNKYGLTALCPIIIDPDRTPSHDAEIRVLLNPMPNGKDSPFARFSSTHLCRLLVMDDVFFEGHPAKLDHLRSSYLVFTSNFDGELDDYADAMREAMPGEIDKVWSHCTGYPGLSDAKAWRDYIKRCQVTTTFFFADVNDGTLTNTLRALRLQADFAQFVIGHQGKPAAETQKAFLEFMQRQSGLPTPKPGSTYYGSERSAHVSA